MNLIDAIKSGRPWRIQGTTANHWWVRLVKDERLGLCFEDIGGNRAGVVPADFELAYEIQEPTVTITATQFREACEKLWDGKWTYACYQLGKTLGIGHCSEKPLKVSQGHGSQRRSFGRQLEQHGSRL